MRPVPVILLCLLLFTENSHAQNGYNFKFKTYTYNDGLVHNFTKKCQQDSKGFLWIITQHGLSRFDGVNFKNFEHNPTDSNSLPKNDLEDIAIDSKDRIWLSYKEGLCYYEPVSHRFVNILVSGKPFPSNAIVFDRKRNSIWTVNTTGYTKINAGNLALQHIEYKEKQEVRSQVGKLLIDSKDRLWIPYIRSNYRCIELATSKEYLYKEKIPSMSFFEDDEQNIWLCTWQSGIRLISITDSGHIHTKFGSPFMKIGSEYGFISSGISTSKLLGGKDLLWISTLTGGLLFFDKSSQKMRQFLRYDANNKNGIATDFNEYIFTDRDENIWLCTWHGITKINPKEQEFSSREIPELKNELYNCVAGIVDDPFQKNIYWMAATGSGLLKYDRNTNQLIDKYYYFYNSATRTFTGPDLNYDWRWTSNLFKDSHNQLWATTYAGLIKIKNGKPSQLTLTDRLGKLVYPETSKELSGSIWVAGPKGIFKVDPLTNQYHFYEDVADNIFYDVELLDSNHLLLASEAGLKKFNLTNHSFTGINCPVKRIMNIEIIGRSIYAGGGEGLSVYDVASHKTISVGKSLGIEKIQHNRLRKDAENNLWIYTSHGLFRYYTNNGSFEKFTPSDGIYNLSDDNIGFFSYQNAFYIGYRMALTSFDPLKVNVNTKKVAPVITDIYINNQLQQFSTDSLSKQTLHLNYNENGIRINFTAPDFTNADKITFSYQLDGFDTAWINAGSRRTVAYTNLLPGKYIFRLKAANSSGIWNEKITVLQFYIATPFWKTWWFRLMAISLIATLIYLLYRYRLRQIKKIYEVRSSISRSLHDEVGATLSSINIYSDVARKKTNDPGIRQIIDKVYDASANAMENMSDIVWYVNPKNDLLENLLIRMREYALPLLEARGINVSFEAKENLEELKTSMQQRHHLYLVFKEAVNNALKYSAAKNITISMVMENNQLTMEVKDDGKGFDSHHPFPGNGIKNMQSRAADINAQLNIASSPGHGTVVSLQLIIT